MKDSRIKFIASNIKAERSRKNLTQEQLAEKSKLSRNSISMYERGVQLPSVLVAYDIAKALEIDIHDLLKNLD